MGAGEARLEAVVEELERALGVRFERRESGYLGGEYYRSKVGSGAEIVVRRNYEDDDGELVEPDFPRFATLVDVTAPDDALGSTLASIDGLDRLRSEVV